MAKDLDDILKHIEAVKAAEYQRGWDDALASLKSQLSSINPSKPKIIIEHVKPKAKGPKRGYRQGTNISQVHDLVRENPGLSGIEIVQKMRQKDASIEERTVRTSLARLRDKWGGLIVSHNGKWYEKGSVMD